MKTLLFSLFLVAAASALRAQDVATNFSPAIEHQDTAGLSGLVGYSAAQAVPAVEFAPTAALAVPATGTPYESTAHHASASVNGVAVQVQALPGSGTVLISFSMPPQRSLGLLELADARTGQLVYSGSVLVNEGQVELPVSDVNQTFEVRLATDHDLVIARMAR